MLGMSTTPTLSAVPLAELGRGKRLVHAAAAADDHRPVVRTLAQDVPLAHSNT